MSVQTLIYDTEGDGLLATTKKLHCAAAYEYETGRSWAFRPHQIKSEFLPLLSQAKTLVCHNQIQHDLPVLHKLFKWRPRPGQRIFDTLVMVRLAFGYQKELDFQLWREGKLPGRLIGWHSLEAWGHRLGVFKGDYAKEMQAEGKDPWAEFNERMLAYNVDDVTLNTALYKKCLQARILPNVLEDEQEIQDLVGRMEIWGFPFREGKARRLAHQLRVRKGRLVERAKQEIGIWYKPEKAQPCLPQDNNGYTFAPLVVTPTKNLNYKDPKRADRTAGAPFCPVKLMEFNPQSRPQIINRLKTMYGWNPVDFTEKGNPEVSDTVLRSLEDHIPICGLLADVFYYNKRLSQIATGKNAWLKMIGKDGAIHGRINPLGTVSRRASHSSPNVAQVPKVASKPRIFCEGTDHERKIELLLRGKPGGLGFECRSLFFVPPPWRLMGSDLAGIEFRCLAELCAKYDGGELIDVLLNQDIHTANQLAAGLETRNQAKTFIYAFMYGGGDAKLGSIVKPLASESEQRAIGAALRAEFLRKMPALAAVVKDVQRQAAQGYVIALDGGGLYVRSRHSALNLKLQSDAALLAKRWLRNFYRGMLAEGLKSGWGRDFVLSAWVHDEIQAPCADQEIAMIAGRISKMAAEKAGHDFNYTCPIASDFKVGQTWMETH